MNTPAQHPKKLDHVYHCALRFIHVCRIRVHLCTFDAIAQCPSLCVDSHTGLFFVYKFIIGLLPSELCTYLYKNQQLLAFVLSKNASVDRAGGQGQSCV